MQVVHAEELRRATGMRGYQIITNYTVIANVSATAASAGQCYRAGE